jgi:hypothetical protein
MTLNGDLVHFPIIDIIQLLNGARKSGILHLSSDKGESQLVFHEGDLVSANFLNNRVRIGQVLVSAGAITEEQLAQALDIQRDAGDDRKPLVITLLEHDMVDETAAYNGIESLIEMTVVEVLTWKDGHFSLDVAQSDHAGGYHFSRIKFPQRILLNAQGVLMDSLRIFDEKVRDGSMDEILSIAGVSNRDLDAEQPGSYAPAITSNGRDLDDGPSKLQQLLDEQRDMIQRSDDQSYRATDAVKKLIVDEFPSASKEQKRQLLSLLAGPLPDVDATTAPPSIAVIVITQSPLLSTMVRSICFQEGVYAVSTDNIAWRYHAGHAADLQGPAEIPPGVGCSGRLFAFLGQAGSAGTRFGNTFNHSAALQGMCARTPGAAGTGFLFRVGSLSPNPVVGSQQQR